MIANMTNANRVFSLLSKAFNLAEMWGYRDEGTNPCRHIKKFPEKSRERFLSEEEITRLFMTLKNIEKSQSEHITFTTAIRLLLLTGCRLTEILTLKWEYIDIKNYRINLPDSKNGKKSVYISPMVVEMLAKIDRQSNNPYVLQGKNGESHLVNLQRAWRRIRKQAVLEDVRIHDLRHSFASIGAASGLSLPLIGALLGHTQVQTTARYAHLIGDPLREAAHVIGTKMKSIME
jgi:integrase